MSYGHVTACLPVANSDMTAASRMSDSPSPLSSSCGTNSGTTSYSRVPHPCCRNGRPILTDSRPGHEACSCQYNTLLSSYSRLPLVSNIFHHGQSLPTGPQSVYTTPPTEGSAFYTPLRAKRNCSRDTSDTWRPHNQSTLPEAPPISFYPYRSSYGGLDANFRRKSSTSESTNTLKAWLQEHLKNPYPSKGEKIMLAIITKMTLTQVSTWFANARRRLKKENKVSWSPLDKSDDGDDDDDEEEDFLCSDEKNSNSAERADETIGVSRKTSPTIVEMDSETTNKTVSTNKNSNNISQSGTELRRSPAHPSSGLSQAETDTNKRKIWSVEDFLSFDTINRKDNLTNQKTDTVKQHSNHNLLDIASNGRDITIFGHHQKVPSEESVFAHGLQIPAHQSTLMNEKGAFLYSFEKSHIRSSVSSGVSRFHPFLSTRAIRMDSV